MDDWVSSAPPERFTNAFGIGDAERVETVDALREHFVTGRLSLPEFIRRMSAALESHYPWELWKLLKDLPPLG